MFKVQLTAAALISAMATSAATAEGIATRHHGAVGIHSVSTSMSPFTGALRAKPAMGCTAPAASLVEIRALLGAPCSPALCLAEPAETRSAPALLCTPADAAN